MMGRTRIMVVEDEKHLGALFGEVLEGMGFIVCAIESTEHNAIAAAMRCKPDLMLVDIHLADGNGMSAVTEILRHGFVPHVFYSGDISGVRESCPHAIALQKPFRVSQLAQAIDRALSDVAGNEEQRKATD
jgi:DNA-binding NtrC family response regulator